MQIANSGCGVHRRRPSSERVARLRSVIALGKDFINSVSTSQRASRNSWPEPVRYTSVNRFRRAVEGKALEAISSITSD